MSDIKLEPVVPGQDRCTNPGCKRRALMGCWFCRECTDAKESGYRKHEQECGCNLWVHIMEYRETALQEAV